MPEPLNRSAITNLSPLIRCENADFTPVKKLISLDEPVMETHGSSRDGLPSQVSPVPLTWRLADTLIVIVLAALSFFGALKGADRINSGLLVNKDTFDVWFDGDLVRYQEMMSVRDGNHNRTSRHPLFPLFTYPPVKALRLLGFDNVAAVRIVIAAVGSACVVSLFFLLRLLGCRRFDATLFSIISAVSAASMFWFVVPETYSFGSLTILLALIIVVLGDFRHIAPVWYVIISALTLSFTTTNWMIGVLVTFVRFRLFRIIKISLCTFAAVLLLWCVQKAIFPQGYFFFYVPTAENGGDQFVFSRRAGGPVKIVNAAVFHSIVMPAIEETEPPSPDEGPVMTVQMSSPGSASLWGKVAVVAWAGLLVLGLWGLLFLGRHHRMRIVLTLSFMGLLALYLVFGLETFLYSLHFTPLLIVLAALGTLTAARPVALILASTLIVSAGVNNIKQFNKATDFVALHHVTQHQEVREAMERRPDDPWPRSAGHVVLAIPGSLDREKAYHEPGGSFSPALNSFGISIWIAGKQGTLLATSDTISPNLMSQSFTWGEKENIPSILTKSGYYETLWSYAGPGRWKLKLKAYPNKDTTPMVVVRSVGPAGGPVTSLDWNGQRLLINGRWALSITPGPSSTHIGQEGPAGWMMASSNTTRWDRRDGWGFARLELAGRSNAELLVEDTASNTKAPVGLPSVDLKSTADLNLPDPRFAASLNAQVAHLMMGLVGQETRPADPSSYPLSWTRPEAYIVAALARAGRLDTAKVLSTHLAENDFLGGFGPEADALGLAIWSLEEVALRVNRPDYDRWLWPHVRRKANLIEQMMSSDKEIRQLPVGPVRPQNRFNPDLSLLSKPAQNGLVAGKTERGLSPLFDTAVSYRGLLDAAELAHRLKEHSEAERWRARASDLQKAWAGAFSKLESKDARAYAIWPTGIWSSDPAGFFRGLEAQRVKLYDQSGKLYRSPLRTHISIAETHQWLFLERQDNVWVTLEWLWNDQASPGLYTWWENSAFKDVVTDYVTPFRLWEQTRGWNKRPYVTPEYQAAAEMLFLQLDMLAYSDEMASEPTLVIGSGVRPSWLSTPMSVQRISTARAEVGWGWDGHEMRVTIRGCRCKVRLGPAFSADTPVRVEYPRSSGTRSK